MLSLLTRQLAKFAVVTLVVVSVLVGLSQTAQAAVSLDKTPDLVNVVTVYPTTSETQSEILSEVSEAEAFTFASVPGFKDSAILKAQDDSQVIALSQWNGKDLTSFESYAKEHVLSIPAGQSAQSFACQVQHTETRAASPKFQQGDVVMFSQFKMKPNKAQSELAMVISQMMPGVLDMISGLQWAAMCSSTDESTIALLARWNSRDDFKSLGQKAGFDPETNYWQDYANNEHGLYDVVEIIR
ncbi:hypothetical protein N836_34490 [Leptolyngbya sp. Heron Island J]|uniref:hypothetical protein n=1 Tax=Leptolyngbya sp. Heron Island J TaxID=1385935 RepID=UPI0003B990DE|nr:hypothetical protein [Leptolyngbya sp. Heron Island J]ESA37904.1 hypothetical protein N836_34490 [Leptolyngbya sp. Heron Island J]